jgi:hypothetical protein
MATMLYAQNISGVDYIFDLAYTVTNWGREASWDGPAEDFSFNISKITYAVDDGRDAVLLPAPMSIAEKIDLAQLGEVIRWVAIEAAVGADFADTLRDTLRNNAA